MYYNLNDKIAIVTGGGRGIGRSIAEQLGLCGAHVLIAEIDVKAAEKTAEELAAQGCRSSVVTVDLSKTSSISKMISEVVSKHRRIDILVNNAAVTKSMDFFEVSRQDWDWIHSVNARGLFFTMQGVAKVMKPQMSGKIINISSGAGKGFPGTSNISYGASKGAVITMTRLAAHALGQFNINVNGVCPGVTHTELYWKVVQGKARIFKKSEDQIAAELEAQIPIRRANEPVDIAMTTLFLASDAARNVTGQCWNVDGGLVFD